VLRGLFRSKSQSGGAERLYAAAVSQARSPAFYVEMGVADRIDARFELYTLHVLLLVLRLKDEGAAGADPAQDLFDAYVSALDHALRELGVGDVSMARKMRSLGQALYGRMSAYEGPLRAGEAAALSQGLARNVMESEAATEASDRLAAYALTARAALAEQPLSDILAGKPAWPQAGAAA
jgi:cytochrome b pre-mRNA-processing protein 3